MFHKISIDVVEMVIVLSDKYSLFESLQKILSKLTESNRKARINDKMTKMYVIDDGYMDYILDGDEHREYDKPYRVDLSDHMDSSSDEIILIFEWGRKKGPEMIFSNFRSSTRYRDIHEDFIYDKDYLHLYIDVYERRRKFNKWLSLKTALDST